MLRLCYPVLLEDRLLVRERRCQVDKHGYVRYWWMGELNWEGAEGEKLFGRHIEELLAEQ